MAFSDRRPFAPPYRMACLVLGCVGLLMLPCCRSGSQDGGTLAGASQAGRRPNIIFLTVDTLRADHMALYGYVRNTMPAIEAFAKTAIVFDNAVVSRGATRPSYASMMTGLYPFHHGLHGNDAVVHDDLTMLAEVLKTAGYYTAGFVSNPIIAGKFSGLDQGFDVYDDRVLPDANHPDGFERKADKTLEAILKWLDSDPPEPFFLFTNFIDPHGPYLPPERFRAMYDSVKVRLVDRDQMPTYQRVPGQFNYYDYVDRYDAEIRFVDESLGVLIDALKRKGLWDDALVVFVADHGECMGQHNIYFEHVLHVWDETMHVPLAIRLPASQGGRDRPAGERISRAPRRVAGLCSPMDLTPTVLDHLGLSTDVDFDGRSLLPLMAGKDDDDRAMLLECPTTATLWYDPPLDDLYAIRTRTHKLIRLFDHKTGKRLQQGVFHVAADRLEQHHIRFDPADPLHRRLSDRLEAILEESRSYKLPFTLTVYEYKSRKSPTTQAEKDGILRKALTPEQVERLRSLGYTQ